MWRASLLALILLTACKDRRSFEERYRDTSKQIGQKERALSENLSNDMSFEQAPAGPAHNQTRQ